MASILKDIPEEIHVLAYTWKRGSASGGTREVYLRLADVERRIQTLLDSGESSPDRMTVWSLRNGEWQQMKITPALPTRVFHHEEAPDA